MSQATVYELPFAAAGGGTTAYTLPEVLTAGGAATVGTTQHSVPALNATAAAPPDGIAARVNGTDAPGSLHFDLQVGSVGRQARRPPACLVQRAGRASLVSVAAQSVVHRAELGGDVRPRVSLQSWHTLQYALPQPFTFALTPDVPAAGPAPAAALRRWLPAGVERVRRRATGGWTVPQQPPTAGLARRLVDTTIQCVSAEPPPSRGTHSGGTACCMVPDLHC